MYARGIRLSERTGYEMKSVESGSYNLFIHFLRLLAADVHIGEQSKGEARQSAAPGQAPDGVEKAISLL